MDPRPYNYEYRRPRLSNPTFQSLNLYQSLYHKDVKNRYQINNTSSYQPPNNFFVSNQYQSPTQRNLKNKHYAEKYAASFIENNSSFTKDNKNIASSVMIDSQNPEYARPNSNRSNQSNDWNLKQQRPSKLASYGRSSMFKNHEKGQSYVEQKLQEKLKSNSGVYDRLNQFSVYQKQQKPYSIVGNYPRSTSIELKKYPKLTLQHKLIEKGRYNPSP